ncbi:surface antigen BspA-like [Trichomonas vaginalis G3]|uniref:Surface antigen BspA-like n=1 Tax=Trichomonas vaginalis (strain ATCC PRA-98 / G3) TaxID=412133 RepID=A2EDK8_TRIV3|nr:ribonuclease inhibitor domain-containing protein [Trichomonas vaginalis G3]EAY09273.1 surface antigen BspA-like [Trichomonas vaginalis G3]KAI5484060.1 ribonuclease inhibitor domain-containing protein [Trichomonas vaginalis G3]|eukprot:XP_001321496.1 surface antigen BspA-like [Trichomonas vaginalis G3]
MIFFDHCDKLTEIEVISDNYILENYAIYDKEKTKIISFSTVSPLESFIVPDNIQELSDFSFCGTKNLKNLACNHFVRIGIGAFLKSSLENIVFTDVNNNYQMEMFTFSYSQNLKYVEIICQQFPMFDFLYCVNLEYIKAPLTQIGDGVFMHCKSLKEIKLKDVTEIGIKSFFDCKTLKQIKFGPKIQNIGSYAFKNCINIEVVEFLQVCNLYNIEIGIFQNCVRLSSVTLPLYLNAIFDLAFANTSLREIRVPSVAEVMPHAFYYNQNLIRVINTDVFEHELRIYAASEYRIITTLGKQNSTYNVSDGFSFINVEAINSHHIFNDTIGAYENDLGIRTLIVPESINYIGPFNNGLFYTLGSHFLENVCTNNSNLRIEIPYFYIILNFNYDVYTPLDTEIQGNARLYDYDSPIPYPKIYAPNMKVSRTNDFGFQVINEPCPDSVTPAEKIIDKSTINYKKVIVKRDQSKTSNANSGSKIESSFDPIILNNDERSVNPNSNITLRETITISICASIVVIVIILAILYVYMKTKAPTLSDDSDILEMAKETIHASTAVTFDNPLFMTTSAFPDDPFASDFQNEEINIDCFNKDDLDE